MEPWRLTDAISRATVVTLNGAIVIAGGLRADGTTTGAVVRLDPSSGRQTALGSLAQQTHDAAGAVFGGTLFVFGGGVSATVPTVQSFANGRSAKAGTLPQPRSDLSVATVGARAIVAGGYDGTTLLRAVLATTDGTHFTQIASLARPVRYAAIASNGSTVYVFGGTTGSRDSADIQVLDLSAGATKIAGHLPVPLSHATAFTLAGSVYVAGGRSNGRVLGTVYRFDPATGAVTKVATLPVAISDAGAVVIGARAYLVGGEDSRSRASVMSCSGA